MDGLCSMSSYLDMRGTLVLFGFCGSSATPQTPSPFPQPQLTIFASPLLLDLRHFCKDAHCKLDERATDETFFHRAVNIRLPTDSVTLFSVVLVQSGPWPCQFRLSTTPSYVALAPNSNAADRGASLHFALMLFPSRLWCDPTAHIGALPIMPLWNFFASSALYPTLGLSCKKPSGTKMGKRMSPLTSGWPIFLSSLYSLVVIITVAPFLLNPL
jgi:hypothetical protein